MQCSDCHHQVEDPEALFCSQCGKPLRWDDRCSFCGKPLQPLARYCDRCGAPADPAADQDAAHPIPFPRNTPPITAVSDAELEQQKAIIKRLVEEEVKRRVGEAQVERNVTRSIKKEQARQAKLTKCGLQESDWAVIQTGSYIMGSPPEEKDRFDNERQHQVEVKRFEILKTPVTFEMFDIYCDEMNLARIHDEGWGREDRPIINIAYWSAVDYCIWLSKVTGDIIRLPTEAEWEYACRAGTTTPFWTGETITTGQANFDGNYTYGGSEKGISRGKTTPVTQFFPNPWGLYDMHGNVWEWCASIFDEEYNGLELEDAGFNEEELSERVVRGGSWHNVPGGIRSAIRNKLRPDYRYLRVGFRIVREIKK
jgi:formylglycine-generating enzyme required for sulfatase activity